MRLLPVEVDHIELIRTWRNSPQVNEGMIWREPITPEMQQTWYKKISKDANAAYFIIEEQAGGTPVGVVDIKKIDQRHRNAEWGIFMGESAHRGQGFATEAACLLLHHAFKQLKLHKVKATLLADNTASIRFHKSLGFKLEAHLRQEASIDDQFHDVLLGGLLKQDFYNAAKPQATLLEVGINLPARI